jgi:hypothetical protein
MIQSTEHFESLADRIRIYLLSAATVQGEPWMGRKSKGRLAVLP